MNACSKSDGVIPGLGHFVHKVSQGAMHPPPPTHTHTSMFPIQPQHVGESQVWRAVLVFESSADLVDRVFKGSCGRRRGVLKLLGYRRRRHVNFFLTIFWGIKNPAYQFNRLVFSVSIVLHLWSFTVFFIIMCGLLVLWGGKRKSVATNRYILSFLLFLYWFYANKAKIMYKCY